MYNRYFTIDYLCNSCIGHYVLDILSRGLAGLAHGLLHVAKLALLGKVPMLLQALLLLGGKMLLSGHNTSILGEEQLLLGQFTGGLVSRTVEYLGTGTKQFLVFSAVHRIHAIIATNRSLHCYV
jgi:hypothetical protein